MIDLYATGVGYTQFSKNNKKRAFIFNMTKFNYITNSMSPSLDIYFNKLNRFNIFKDSYTLVLKNLSKVMQYVKQFKQSTRPEKPKKYIHTIHLKNN